MADRLKIALVHDWLTGMRGGEKVLEIFCELFPNADVYTLVYVPEKMSETIQKMNIKTSLLQKLPNVSNNYRYYLPIMPKMIEGFYLDKYDLILSSSHCVAKGIRFKSGTRHICYCHTPMRYIWDMYDEYFGNAGLLTKAVMKIFLNFLKKWDINSSKRVNYFIANSKTVQERILRIYNRHAEVIYPPVDTDKFFVKESDQKSDYYLYVGAFAAYKKVDLVVDAFNKTGKKILIIGDGQGFKKIKTQAKKNVQLLGWVEEDTLRKYYAQAKALIFTANEDFGIVPLEAMACGTPVIAFGKGGATETVIEKKTGIFFKEQTSEALINAVVRFENLTWDKKVLNKHAEKYSRKYFKNNIKNFINGCIMPQD